MTQKHIWIVEYKDTNGLWCPMNTNDFFWKDVKDKEDWQYWYTRSLFYSRSTAREVARAMHKYNIYNVSYRAAKYVRQA